MPNKENIIWDEERRKRLRETAREHETSDNPKDVEGTIAKITSKRFTEYYG